MVTEEQKFRAETYRITGFAMLTPIGRILLDPLPLFNEYELTPFIFYLTFSIIAGIIGFLLIEKARGILFVKRYNKWE